MGRVIIKFNDGTSESFKCKSKERGEEIAGKRRSVKSVNFYADNEHIPVSKKKKVEKKELTIEEMERMLGIM